MNIIVFFGVNGSGKSILVKKLQRKLIGTKVINASLDLMRFFGLSSRQELSNFSLKEKVRALVKIIENYDVRGCSYLLLDYHLVLPDGNGDYMNYWHPLLEKMTSQIFFIKGDPKEILHRRLKSLNNRDRNCCLHEIKKTQTANLQALSNLNPPHRIILNQQGRLEETCEEILKSLSK